MMMLVGMSDPGLLILPTHRLVTGFPGLTADALAERLAAEFDVAFSGTGAEARRAAWEEVELWGGQDMIGLRHRRGRPLAHREAPRRLDHGPARPRPQPRVALRSA